MSNTEIEFYIQQSFQKGNMFVKIFVIFFGFVHLGLGAHLPPGINLCHRSSPDFKKCFGKAVGESIKLLADGNKFYGLPTLDPIYLKEFVLKGRSSPTISIEQKYTDAYVYGLSNSKSEQNVDIELDQKCGWVVDVVTPVVKLEADYRVTGKLLMFPINGFGRCNITIYGLVSRHTMTCEKYTVKDKTHLKVTNYTIDMKVDKAVFYYDNLFEGNEQISAEILKTMNENSMLVFDELKGGFEEVFGLIHMTMANKLFSKEPLDNIFLD